MPAAAPARGTEAPVLAIFGSRQGEGPCVGDGQVFVRFGGCNLACDYCDTPESIPAQSGTRRSLPDVLASVDAVAGRGRFKAVSLTGGEPLLHVTFLERLIPALRERGLRIYLETNGTLPQALDRIVEGCDWIAMDFKPASAVSRDLWEAQRWFLSKGGKKVFVKLVLTSVTKKEELQRAAALIASARSDIPLVLQPATPIANVQSIPLERLASWWAWAASRLPDVRVIPQVHRLWDIP